MRPGRPPPGPARRPAAVQAAGGRVLLVGDPRQLGAPGAGGGLALVEADAQERVQYPTEVRRFRNPDKSPRTWEIDAARQISRGDVASFDAYQLRGRIHHGHVDVLVDQLYRDWHRDRAEGLTSIMIGSSNATVARLSARARADRVAAGLVDDTGAVDLRDGNRAGVGDLVVTRTNQRRLVTADGRQYVRNGDLWEVTAAVSGSLTVRHEKSGRTVVLPADYVAGSVDLGYALTKDRAQGVTVDVGRCLFDDGMDRNGAYPGLTRGRYANHAYLVTRGGIDPETGEPARERTPRAVWDGIISRDGTQYSATATGRRRFDEAASLRALTGRLIHVLDDLQDQRAQKAVADLLGERAARRLAQAPAWPALRAQLSDLADQGYDTDRLLQQAWADPRGNEHAWNLETRQVGPIQDLAAILHARNAALIAEHGPDFHQPPDAGRPVTAPTYRTDPDPTAGADLIDAMGLLLPADGEGGEIGELARQLADLARARADRQSELALARAEAGQDWAAAYGPRPDDADQALAWEQRVAAAASWRDLARYTGTNPLGETPDPQRGEERALWRAAQPLPDPMERAAELAAAGPAWLDILGAPPAVGDELRPLWDHAAAAIATYRDLWDYGHEQTALGERPTEPVAAADWDRAHQGVETWDARRTRPQLPVDREQLRVLDVQGREAAERAHRTAEAQAALDRARRDQAIAEQRAQDTRARADAAATQARTPEQHRQAEQLAAQADRDRAAADAAAQRLADADEAARSDAGQELRDRESARRGEQARRSLSSPAAPTAAPQAPDWTERPFGRYPEPELRRRHQQALDAAAALTATAVTAEETAQRLDERLLPGGAVDQQTAARHARVQAVLDLRALEAQTGERREQTGRLTREQRAVAGQLTATGPFGRQAVRGNERATLQHRLDDLAAELRQLAEQAETDRQRLQELALQAGDVAEHDRLLADWEREGASLDAVRDRLRATTAQDAERQRTAATETRSQAGTQRDAAQQIRREVAVRRTMDPERLQTEDTQRAEAQQRAAAEQGRRAAARRAQQHNQQQRPQQGGPRQSI